MSSMHGNASAKSEFSWTPVCLLRGLRCAATEPVSLSVVSLLWLLPGGANFLCSLRLDVVALGTQIRFWLWLGQFASTHVSWIWCARCLRLHSARRFLFKNSLQRTSLQVFPLRWVLFVAIRLVGLVTLDTFRKPQFPSKGILISI